MNCDICAFRSTCKMRTAPGRHRMDVCDEYFPDWMRPEARKPKKIRTPEDQREEMETRD